MHRRPTLARTVRWLLLAVAVFVCLPPIFAQSKDFARIIEMHGQVSVLRSGQVALFQNDTVHAAEMIVSGPDGYARFQIADGSTFEVFPNSRVSFRNTFSFQELLDVTLGRIRVMIEHRNGPNHKKVSTPTAVISVRGTVFDVAVEDTDGTTLVAVEEGQVQVDHRLQPNSVPKILNPNDWVRVYPNQPLAKAKGPSPGAQGMIDELKRVGIDVARGMGGPRGPGTIPGGAGGTSPTNTGQGDGGGKTKKPPTGAPPPTPGGGD